MSEQEKVWEIINPSDPYTIAGDLEAVRLAVILLGVGAYGLRPYEETGAEGDLPPLMFGGADAWLAENIGDLDERVDARHEDIAKALRGVMIGGLDQRKLGTSGDLEFHDERRSSMNDIGRKVWKLAERMAAGPSWKATGENDG